MTWTSDERDAMGCGRVRRCVVTDRFAAHSASCEDADPAGANEETDDDEDDAEQNLPSERGDDPGDDENHGDDPQQSGHETSRVQRSTRWRVTVHTTTCSGGCVHPEG
jgi:hypothetical protein